jgi:hypothetical protein
MQNHEDIVQDAMYRLFTDPEDSAAMAIVIDELEETTLVPSVVIQRYLAQVQWTQRPALTIDILRQRVVDDYNDPDPVADDDRAYRWQVANDLQYLNR